MALWTCVARDTDGLPLVETWSGNEAGRFSARLKQESTQLLARARQLPARGSYDSAGGFVFHIFVGDGLSFLALFERCYPPNLAFTYLEELRWFFQEELKREFGTGSVDYRSRIETLDRPYSFQKLDRQISRLRAEYQDPSSSKALAKLRSNIVQVSNIMKHNIDEILLRGENLESMSDKASQLRAESKNFSDMAQLLASRAFLQRACALVLVCLILLLEFCENKQAKLVAQFGLALVFIVCLCLGVGRNEPGSFLSWPGTWRGSSESKRFQYINLPSGADEDADRLC